MDTESSLCAKLVQSIQDSLAHFLVPNAIFLAERLLAFRNNDYNRNVLATCYYRANKPQQTYTLLKPFLTTPENRYLFALACVDLEYFQEAENALIESPDDLTHTNVEELVPNGAAGLYLLGQIYVRRGQKPRAIQALRAALRLNPFLFQAYLLLCRLGCQDEPSEFYGGSDGQEGEGFPEDDEAWFRPLSMPVGDMSNSRTICSTPMLTPMMINGTLHHVPSPAPAVTPFLSGLHQSSAFTITPNKSVCFTPIKAPLGFGSEVHEPLTPDTHDGFMSPPKTRAPPKPKGIDAAPRGRVSRRARTVLFADTPGTVDKPTTREKEHSQKSKPPAHSLNLANVTERAPRREAQPVAPDWTPVTSDMVKPQERSFVTPAIIPSVPDHEEFTIISAPALAEGAALLLQMLGSIARAYQYLCQYRCQEAIEAFQELPEEQYETGWVLTQVGKAYLELSDYLKGKEIFERIRRLEPYRVEGMELYSTILWYLRQQVELSYLAHELVEFDRQAPESWCVVGNCFGLQKEHSSALKLFKRAIQLDSSFAYAYTLSGHEYMSMDDLEKAAVCFRNAIQLDERHYNAWYGLGMIYFRQEQMDLAEFHFQKAIAIHPTNSVLHYRLAMLLQSENRLEEALERLDHTMQLAPQNNMVVFQKARVVALLGDFVESIELLEKLNQQVPKQAQIYYAMGHLHHQVGQSDEAIRCLTIALDLDSQNASLIKLALEKIQDKDDDPINIADVFDFS